MRGDVCGCGRLITRTGNFCNYCCVKKYREANPMYYAYMAKRDNAKRKGIEFTISFEYFKEFCYKTQYMSKRGRSATSYAIDRIKNHLGYIPGNLQALTNRDNVIKKKLDAALAKEGVYTVVKINDRPKTDNSDVPF